MLPNRAAGYVLQCIADAVAAGTPAISYQDIQNQTGYTIPTIWNAIRQLKNQNWIQVETGGPRRPNRYRLLTDEQRKTRAIAQFVGLIQ